jgi:hypothetical protein
VRSHDPFIQYLAALTHTRLGRLRHAWQDRLAGGRDERAAEAGYSTEAVIVTALLVAAAIIAIGYIAVKVKAAAQGIKTK